MVVYRYKENVSKSVSKILEKVTTGSTLFNKEREESYPIFQFEELQLGRVLGRGGFCVVNEIQDFKLNETFLDHEVKQNKLDKSNQQRRRNDLLTRVKKGQEARYAIKRLSDEHYEDDEMLEKGIADLAIESKFLSVLEHPHIIKMRGVCFGNINKPDYFIILDKLYDSFDRKLIKWKSEEKKFGGLISKLKDKKGQKKNEFLASKLNCAYDLASALKFLHERNIIYRDLKPDNIGFDIRDEPKIFDLGLAKQIHSKDALPNGLYNLTGWTGSMKYMAPEVAHMQPYSYSADVYSYGIVLWQILSCDQPYRKYTIRMLEDYVMKQGYRPKVNPKWRKTCKKLVVDCWDPTAVNRPNFQKVMEILRNEVYSLLDDDDVSDLDMDASTKSRSSTKSK